MKIAKRKLEQIIQEEIRSILKESNGIGPGTQGLTSADVLRSKEQERTKGLGSYDYDDPNISPDEHSLIQTLYNQLMMVSTLEKLANEPVILDLARRLHQELNKHLPQEEAPAEEASDSGL